MLPIINNFIIEHINERKEQYDVEVMYSTPSRYFKSVGDYLTANPEVKFSYYHGDFFPYADNEDSYWTVPLKFCFNFQSGVFQGYYTTRPTLKAICRKSPSVLRSAEMLYSLGRSTQSDIEWDEAYTFLQSSRRVNHLCTILCIEYLLVTEHIIGGSS